MAAQLQQSETMELDEFVATARRLRLEAKNSELAMFEFLYAGDIAGVHGRTGFATFLDLVKQTDIVAPQRYARFRQGVDDLGLDRVRQIGVDGLTDVLKIPRLAQSISQPTMNARQAMVGDCAGFLERNHVLVSQQHAERLASLHYIAPRKIVTRTPLESAQDRIKDLELRLARSLCEARSYAQALGPARTAEITKTIDKKDVATALKSIRAETAKG